MKRFRPLVTIHSRCLSCVSANASRLLKTVPWLSEFLSITSNPHRPSPIESRTHVVPLAFLLRPCHGDDPHRRDDQVAIKSHHGQRGGDFLGKPTVEVDLA